MLLLSYTEGRGEGAQCQPNERISDWKYNLVSLIQRLLFHYRLRILMRLNSERR